MDARYLLPLRDRVASLAVPCEVHPDARSIDEDTDAWARRTGLIIGDADTSALGRARFGRMAARIFPDSPADRVALFTRWLIWLFAFDDARDGGSLGASATAVDGVYSGLLMALRRGHARPGAGPLEVAFADLWAGTAPLMGPAWRQRFLAGLEEHRRACREEAVLRRTGGVPGVADYPALRRRTSGPFMYDLAEPVLGVELPAALLRSPAWLALVRGTADLVAWCNDVVSHPAERPQGAVCNYLTVLARGYGLDPAQTVVWVVDRIAERAPEIAAAARLLPATYRRLELDAAAAAAADRAAGVLLDAPRAHLEWLLETGRYSLDEDAGALPEQPDSVRIPRQAAPRRRRLDPRLPALP